MTQQKIIWHPLQRHPSTAASPVDRIEAGVSWQENGSLLLSYRLFGDLSRIEIPAPAPSQRSDGLWQHTCCEAFIAFSGETAYREFNFSPSGQWAAYAFSGYRQADDGAFIAPPPAIDIRSSDGELELQVLLDLHTLPSGRHIGELRLGLSVVVEEHCSAGATHSYWALKHPAERPDFHHRGGFHLRLPAAAPTC